MKHLHNSYQRNGGQMSRGACICLSVLHSENDWDSILQYEQLFKIIYKNWVGRANEDRREKG